MLLHAFLPPLLIRNKLLLLRVVQDRLDLAARVLANALELGYLIFARQGSVLTQRLHLLMLVCKDRLDLRLLVRGQAIALGHVRNLLIGVQMFMAPLSLTVGRWLRTGCGVILLRKSGSGAKGESRG